MYLKEISREFLVVVLRNLCKKRMFSYSPESMETVSFKISLPFKNYSMTYMTDSSLKYVFVPLKSSSKLVTETVSRDSKTLSKH